MTAQLLVEKGKPEIGELPDKERYHILSLFLTLSVVYSKTLVLLLLNRVCKGIENLLEGLDNLVGVLLFPLLSRGLAQISLPNSKESVGPNATREGKLGPSSRDPEANTLERALDLLRSDLCARNAVADDGGGLAVPLVLEVVDCVLRAPRDAVVVLWDDEDVGVVGGDFCGPALGVLVDELAAGGDVCGDDGLVVDGELEGVEVDDGEGRLGGLGEGGEELVDEGGDVGAETGGAGAGDDDGDFGGHFCKYGRICMSCVFVCLFVCVCV